MFKSQIFSARYLRRFCEDRTVQRRAVHGDLKQAESGVPVTELCRESGMSSADITYIPMRRGFLYLVAIMDWFSRKVLAWRLSNSMDADFCVEALKEALAKYGTPEIFNTDQGSQFTSGAWIDVLTEAKVKISMDGKGRWIDNRMIERLWRSLKYECVYLQAFERGSEAKAGIGKWLAYYNADRPHSTHGILTPNEAYESNTEPTRLAA